MRALTTHASARFFVTAITLILAPGCVTSVLAQNQPSEHHMSTDRLAQVVALDECDPTTFNTVLGPDFCKNIALGIRRLSPNYCKRPPAVLPTRSGTLNLIPFICTKDRFLAWWIRGESLTPLLKFTNSAGASSLDSTEGRPRCLNAQLVFRASP